MHKKSIVLVAVFLLVFTGCASITSETEPKEDMFTPEGNFEVTHENGWKTTISWNKSAEDICVFELSFYQTGPDPASQGWGYNSDHPGKDCTKEDLHRLLVDWRTRTEQDDLIILFPEEKEMLELILAHFE